MGLIRGDGARVTVRFSLIIMALALTGCATTPRQPLYSPEELKATCERRGGWWRADILDGYCEGNSQM